MYPRDPQIVSFPGDEWIDFHPLTIHPQMLLSEAIAYWDHSESKQADPSFLLVVEQRRLLGVLYLRDLLARWTDPAAVAHTRVYDVMRSQEVVLELPKNQDLNELYSPQMLIELFHQNQWDYLPVVTPGYELIGLITASSLFQAWKVSNSIRHQQASPPCLIATNPSPDLGETMALRSVSSPTNFQQTFAQAAIGMAHVDLEGNFVEVNQKFCDLVGYSAAELIHRSFFELMVPQKLRILNNYDYTRVTQRYFDRLLTGKLPFITIENMYITQSGREIWVNITVSVVRQTSGEPDYFVSVIEDISDRKLLEQKLHTSEAELRSVFAAMTQIVLAIDAQAEVIKVSPTRPALTYHQTIDLIGETINQVIYGFYRQDLLKHIEKVIKNQKSVNFEYPLRIQNQQFWFAATLSPMPDKKVIFVSRDITQPKQKEEQLRLLQRAVEVTDNGIIISDAQLPSFPILYVNPAFEKITGYSSEESLGKRFLFIYEQDVTHSQLEKMINAINHGRDCQITLQSYRKNNTIFWSHLSLYALRDESGYLTHYVGLQVDITERIHAEEALRKSEERWQLALQSNNDGIYDWNLETNRIFYSARWKEMLGFSESEINDDPSEWMTRLHPDDFEQVMFTNLHHQDNQDNPLFNIEYRMRCKNGSYKWILDRGQVLYDYQGEEVRIIGSYTDITERKISEEKLRESQQRLEFLVDQTPLGVIEWSVDWQIVEWNKAAERIFGYRREEILSSPHGFELLFSPENKYQAYELIDALETEEETTYDICENLTKTAEKIVCEWYNTVLMDQQHNVIGYASMIADISDRQQAEIALIQAKEAAESANRAKSQFLANMSHELRTPLNAILGFTQLIDRSASLDAIHRKQIRIINRSGEHLLSLINDILEMSKIEAGKIVINPVNFNLWLLLETLKDMLSIKAESKGLNLEFVRSDTVPEYVHGDENKLRQILLNLLGNGIKFTQTGTVRLSVSAPSSYPALLSFEVSDTGPGINPEDLEILFEPFVQTATGRQSQQGTGLGLPISRQFVLLMGGDIKVSSQVGVGTQFTFDIPFIPVIHEPPTLSTSSRIIHLAPNQPNYRILVVDDSLENRLLLQTLLTTVGFEQVKVATNGQEAINLWQEWSPHLIWMDVRMPVMDGIEATKYIKSQLTGNTTIIIALTASAFSEEREQVLAIGCDDFMSKPFQEQELLAKMAQHLQISYVCDYTDKPAFFDCYKESDRVATPQEYRLPDSTTLSVNSNTMPREWLNQMYQAALEADGELMLDLITQIPPHHQPLADHLTELVNNFEFEWITENLKSVLS